MNCWEASVIGTICGVISGLIAGWQLAIGSARRVLKQFYTKEHNFTRYTKNTTVDDFKR